MGRDMAGLDIGIVIAYFVILIGIGVYVSKKTTNQKDFLIAGQRVGYLVTFACLCAVLLGGASTVGTAALGYQYGVSGMWLVTMLGLGLALVGVLLYKRIREVKVYTVAELLTRRFGPPSGAVFDVRVVRCRSGLQRARARRAGPLALRWRAVRARSRAVPDI